MEFTDLLKYRRSTRKFTEQPVSNEDIEKILLAGSAAPVGSNLYKDLHFTVVTDRQILHTLAEAARYRLKDKETMRKIVRSIPGKENVENEFDPFYGSSCVIFVSHRRQDLQPGIEYSNVATTVLAMHLAATDLGLGSVFMWGSLEAMRIYPQFDHTDLLELPDNFEPLLGLAVGYAETPLKERELRKDKIGVNYINPERIHP